jgi:hypothetical protein
MQRLLFLRLAFLFLARLCLGSVLPTYDCEATVQKCPAPQWTQATAPDLHHLFSLTRTHAGTRSPDPTAAATSASSHSLSRFARPTRQLLEQSTHQKEDHLAEADSQQTFQQQPQLTHVPFGGNATRAFAMWTRSYPTNHAMLIHRTLNKVRNYQNVFFTREHCNNVAPSLRNSPAPLSSHISYTYFLLSFTCGFPFF